MSWELWAKAPTTSCLGGSEVVAANMWVLLSSLQILHGRSGFRVLSFPVFWRGVSIQKHRTELQHWGKLSSLSYSSTHSCLPSYCASVSLPLKTLPLRSSSPSWFLSFLIVSYIWFESRTPTLVICSSTPGSAHSQMGLAIVHWYLGTNHCSPTRFYMHWVQQDPY